MQCTGNSGCFPRWMRAAIVRRYQVVFSCVQFSYFRNPPSSDIDYMIFDVRTFYVCVYTRGWGTPTTSQHNILTRKNSHFVLVLRTGFEPLGMESIGSRGRRSTNWAITSPVVSSRNQCDLVAVCTHIACFPSWPFVNKSIVYRSAYPSVPRFLFVCLFDVVFVLFVVVF